MGHNYKMAVAQNWINEVRCSRVGYLCFTCLDWNACTALLIEWWRYNWNMSLLDWRLLQSWAWYKELIMHHCTVWASGVPLFHNELCRYLEMAAWRCIQMLLLQVSHQITRLLGDHWHSQCETQKEMEQLLKML